MLLGVFVACKNPDKTPAGSGTSGTPVTNAPTQEGVVNPPAVPADASVYSGTPDTSWYTGDKKEYTLTSADQLVGFQELRSKPTDFEGVTIKLGCDVVINPGMTAEIEARGAENHAWRQLNSNHLFKGVFDGQGHIISGLYMKLTTSAVRGMFGGVGGNAEIKNFTLINSFFGGPSSESKNTLGSIVAKVAGGTSAVKISNVVSFATIKEGEAVFSRVGGLVGSVLDGADLTLDGCEFHGSITITGECAGGLIGVVSHKDTDLVMINCRNGATVTAASNAGGLVGQCTLKTLDRTGSRNTGTIVCNGQKGDLFGSFSVMVDPTNGARPEAPAGMTAMRVMSFNVQGSLPATNGTLNENSQNRIEAVRQEILFYSPDVLGLQEDSVTWTNNLYLEGYNLIADASVSSERCAIYYKKGMKLIDSGYAWLTADGTNGTVALTVKDLFTAGGKYSMSAEDLAKINIASNSSDTVLKEKMYKYVDKNGVEQNYSAGYTLLTTRRFTWALFEINGQTVLYANTHLTHRSPNAEYSNDAFQEIRSIERVKEFDIMYAEIEKVLAKHPNTQVFMTGDWNDHPYTDIFNSICDDYGFRSSHLIANEKYGIDGSWNNAFNLDLQGDNYPSKSEGTAASYLDYCFVSPEIDVLKFRVGAGKAEITTKGGDKKTIYTSDHLPIITDLCFKTATTGSFIDPNYKDPTVEDDMTKPSYYSGMNDTTWFTGDKKEYTLTNAAQLMGFITLRAGNTSFEGITVKLGRDIVFNKGTAAEIAANKDAFQWLQFNSAYEFKGTFDGQGHYIAGVSLQTTTSCVRGMFGSMGNNATVKNLTVKDSYFGGTSVNKNTFGVITPRIIGTNVTLSDIQVVDVLMKGGAGWLDKVGGLVGRMDSGSSLTIKNCSVSGTIDFTSGTKIGGLVGSVDNGNCVLVIENSSCSANLSADDYCGGLVGYSASATSVTVTASTATGTLTCQKNKDAVIGNG